jgi:hypothetical protein
MTLANDVDKMSINDLILCYVSGPTAAARLNALVRLHRLATIGADIESLPPYSILQHFDVGVSPVWKCEVTLGNARGEGDTAYEALSSALHGRRERAMQTDDSTQQALREAEDRLRHERAWADRDIGYGDSEIQCSLCGAAIPYWYQTSDEQRDTWYANPDNHDSYCVLAAFYRALDAARSKERE